MGLDIIVRGIGLNRDTRSATIVAERAPNKESRSGVFLLDPANKKLQKRWDDLFGKDKLSLRTPLKIALEAIRQNNASYMKTGEPIEMPYADIRAYKVSVDPYLSIIFQHNGSDPICDKAVVNMMSSAGRTFRLNIAAENGVTTFAQKAIEYLNQEEMLQPVPVPMAKSPAPRRPVISSSATLALNR